jgi:hypothetical protein
MLRSIVAGILIVTLTSCTTWTPVSMSPTHYIRMHDPGAVWVQLRDGSTLVIVRPRVFGDTLRGINAGAFRNIPLSDVTLFRAQEPSKAKTTLLIAALVVGTAGFFYLATNSDRMTP